MKLSLYWNPAEWKKKFVNKMTKKLSYNLK